MLVSDWHLKREISIGHIFTTLTVAISMIIWFKNLENRVEINDLELKSIEKRVDRFETQTNEKFNYIARSLDEIKDRLIDMKKVQPR